MPNISRPDALREADLHIEYLVRSGDPKIIELASLPDGTLSPRKLIPIILKAREKLADTIQAEGRSYLDVLSPHLTYDVKDSEIETTKSESVP